MSQVAIGNGSGLICRAIVDQIDLYILVNQVGEAGGDESLFIVGSQQRNNLRGAPGHNAFLCVFILVHGSTATRPRWCRSHVGASERGRFSRVRQVDATLAKEGLIGDLRSS